MKKILSVFILLIFAASAFAAPPALPPDGPYTADDCNQSQYYALGKLCVDSSGKLWKGTGSGVVEVPQITGTSYLMIGDTANTKNTAGLTVNQGAADDEIISLKSSDINSPFSNQSESDTYGLLKKGNESSGGLSVEGFSNASSSVSGLLLNGSIGTTTPDDGTPAVQIIGNRVNGTTRAALQAGKTVLQVKTYSTALFGILGNGNLQVGGIVTPGTSLARGMVWKSGTAPTTAPADAAQLWVADYLGTAGDSRLHIMGEGSANAHTVMGSGKVSITGTTGGLTRKLSEAVSNIEADESTTITLNIPSGARIIGAQLRVDTALAAGETWDAAYSGGATQAITSAAAVAKNTKIHAMFNTNAATDITSDVTNIAITKNGGGSFTAQGAIRAFVYYEVMDTLADAP